MKRLLVLVMSLWLIGCCSAVSLEPDHLPAPAPTGDVERAYDEAAQAMDLFCGGCKPRLIQTGATAVAAIVVLADDQRVYVLYNRQALQRMVDRYGYEAAVGVFAHELGHLQDLLTDVELSGVEAELSADAWAGCALAITRGDIAPLQDYLLAEAKPSAVHSDPDVRAQAIEDGYATCSGIWGGI